MTSSDSQIEGLKSQWMFDLAYRSINSGHFFCFYCLLFKIKEGTSKESLIYAWRISRVKKWVKKLCQKTNLEGVFEKFVFLSAFSGRQTSWLIR